jgi:hypothetical protein
MKTGSVWDQGFRWKEKVVKVDGYRRIVGQLLAKLQWGVDENFSLRVMIISVYFYLGVINGWRGKNNICHVPLVTY